MLLTNISITRERERGTFEMLISAPISPTEIIFGKTLPYIIISLGNIPLVLAVAIIIFGVPMRGSLLVLGCVSLVFLCSTIAIGTLMSLFTKNQQQAMLGGILMIFPAIIFSGLIFSIENMPMFMRLISYFNPLYHFLLLVRNIMLKGGEIHFILFHTWVLVCMAVVFVYISLKLVRTTLE